MKRYNESKTLKFNKPILSSNTEHVYNYMSCLKLCLNEAQNSNLIFKNLMLIII